MPKPSRTVVPLFSPAEQLAAADTGIELTSEYVRWLKEQIKKKCSADKPVQYYAILDGAVWGPEEFDDRFFAATKLLYEYISPAGGEVSFRDQRIDELKKLILRLATEKATNKGLISPEHLAQLEQLITLQKAITDWLADPTTREQREVVASMYAVVRKIQDGDLSPANGKKKKKASSR